MTSRASGTLAGAAAILAIGHCTLQPWQTAIGQTWSNTILLVGLLGMDYSAASSPLLITVGLLGSTAYAVLRFWLWWRARGGAGRVLLLSSALIGLIPLVSRPLLIMALSMLGEAGAPVLPMVESMAGTWGLFVQPVALLLLAAGIVRAGAAPRWVGLLGIASAVSLGTAHAIVSTRAWGIEVALLSLPEIAFLLALGLSLITEAELPAGESAV